LSKVIDGILFIELFPVNGTTFCRVIAGFVVYQIQFDKIVDAFMKSFSGMALIEDNLVAC